MPSIPARSSRTRESVVTAAERSADRLRRPSFGPSLPSPAPRAAPPTRTPPASNTGETPSSLVTFLPTACHRESHSETDSQVQNDQRTQMTENVLAVFSTTIERLRQVQVVFPRVLALPCLAS